MRDKRILLAESGATKTDWCLCEKGRIMGRYSSIGLNPSTLSPDMIRHEISEFIVQQPLLFAPNQVYFFGAGLRNTHPREQMETILSEKFPTAEEIRVGDDLQAACLATQRPKGIVAILGTGSNAGEFEKGTIIHRSGGLGYILGDEGSGSDLGKYLIAGLLKGDFEESHEVELLQNLQMDREGLRNHLYSLQNPAKWLASLAPILHQYKHLPKIQSLIADRFESFIIQNLLPLPHCHTYPIDFVGSIAIHFQHELKESLERQNLHPGNFISNPIEKLVEIFTNEDSAFTIGEAPA